MDPLSTDSPPEALDFVELKIGGRTWRWSYTIRTLAVLQEDLQQSIEAVFAGINWKQLETGSETEIGAELLRVVKIQHLIHIFWRGLNKYHQEITLERAGDMIHIRNFRRAGRQIVAALSELFGKSEVEDLQDPEVPDSPLSDGGTSPA